MRSHGSTQRLARVTDRPLVARRYSGAWLVLLATLPLGLYRYYGLLRTAVSSGIGGSMTGAYMGVNYHVYHVAAERAVTGEPFYGVSPEPAAGNFVYLYPPGSVAAFVPFAALDWTAGYVAFTLLSLLGGVVTAWLLVRYVEDCGPPLGWVDVALLTGLCVLSIHVSATVFFGNINVLLGFGFAVGFWGLAGDRKTLAGVAFGLAALFKLFPALVGLWLLRDREWRAIGGAVAAGVGGLLAGVALFGPAATAEFFTAVLPGRTDSSTFVGGFPADGEFYVTVQRPLSRLLWAVWPDAPYAVLPVLAALLCGAVLAYFYRNLRDRRERLIAVFVTVVVALVVVPSFRLYAPLVFLPLVALLYSWRGGPGRWLFLAGGVLFSVVARPTHVLTAAESLGPLSGPVTAMGTFATVQLYAYALMLGGCAWHLHRRSPNSIRDEPAASP